MRRPADRLQNGRIKYSTIKPTFKSEVEKAHDAESKEAFLLASHHLRGEPPPLSL